MDSKLFEYRKGPNPWYKCGKAEDKAEQKSIIARQSTARARYIASYHTTIKHFKIRHTFASLAFFVE